MLNHCTFIGHLGKDPETKSFQSGDKIANLSLGVTEKWKDKQSGERKERTEWVSVVLRGGLVDVAEQYLRKGSKVYIAGKMATRKWQDRDGQDRYTTEIVGKELVMLDGKPEGQSSTRGGGGSPAYEEDLDDSVPFVTANPLREGRCG